VDEPINVEFRLDGIDSAAERLEIQQILAVCHRCFGKNDNRAEKACLGNRDELRQWEFVSDTQVTATQNLKNKLERGFRNDVIGIDWDRKDGGILGLKPEGIEGRGTVGNDDVPGPGVVDLLKIRIGIDESSRLAMRRDNAGEEEAHTEENARVRACDKGTDALDWEEARKEGIDRRGRENKHENRKLDKGGQEKWD
jgi:hypothetical protein